MATVAHRMLADLLPELATAGGLAVARWAWALVRPCVTAHLRDLVWRLLEFSEASRDDALERADAELLQQLRRIGGG